MPATRTRRPGTGPAAPVEVETAMTDVANPVATDDAAAAPAEANGKSKKTSAPIQLTVPLDLKAMIETRVAEKSAPSSARYILERFTAQEFPDYTLAPQTRVQTARGGVRMTDVFGKDLTPEQKKDRLASAKTLLDALAKGIVNLDDIKAKLEGGAATA